MKYKKTYEWLDFFCAELKSKELATLFRNCFLSTLTTTVREKEDGSTYVFTGDIPAMWLRDSSAQVNTYIGLCGVDDDMSQMIRGVIKRQFFYISIDPYANAFNEEKNGHGHKDLTLNNDWVWERKFEIDSLCYPLWLTDKYFSITGDTTIFDQEFCKTVEIILTVFETEQKHFKKSNYTFIRENSACDSLENNGRGSNCKENGLVWSAFRPSDDKNTYGYLIPSNMFIVVVMRFLIHVFTEIIPNNVMAERCIQLKSDIEQGLSECAYVETNNGRIFAYETDGYGNHFIADDANVPSLLSLPYLGYCKADDPIYSNTRNYLISKANRYFYKGLFAEGIGSPHTPENYIWPLGLIIQGLTSVSEEEKVSLLRMLINTHAGTYHMHESFHKDDPTKFTRSWFGWADSLFAEFVMSNFELFKNIEF